MKRLILPLIAVLCLPSGIKAEEPKEELKTSTEEKEEIKISTEGIVRINYYIYEIFLWNI